MDSCAELTLRLVRAGQEALNPGSSLRDWVLFPDHRHATWSEVRDLLTAADKPLIVMPLLEPGWIATWSATAWEHEVANQRQYFDAKLEALGLGEGDHVETPDGVFAVAVAEFRRWAAEYSVPVGISMAASPVTRTGRLLIRAPGGCRPPVGWPGC